MTLWQWTLGGVEFVAAFLITTRYPQWARWSIRQWQIAIGAPLTADERKRHEEAFERQRRKLIAARAKLARLEAERRQRRPAPPPRDHDWREHELGYQDRLRRGALLDRFHDDQG